MLICICEYNVMYVLIYLSVKKCGKIYMYLYFLCICFHIFQCTDIYMYIFTCIYTYTCIDSCFLSSSVRDSLVALLKDLFAQYVHVLIYTYTYVIIYVHIHTNIYTYMCIYIYVYT